MSLATAARLEHYKIYRQLAPPVWGSLPDATCTWKVTDEPLGSR